MGAGGGAGIKAPFNVPKLRRRAVMNPVSRERDKCVPVFKKHVVLCAAASQK